MQKEVFREAEEGTHQGRRTEQTTKEKNKDKKDKKIKKKFLIPQKRTLYVFLPNLAYHSQSLACKRLDLLHQGNQEKLYTQAHLFKGKRCLPFPYLECWELMQFNKTGNLLLSVRPGFTQIPLNIMSVYPRLSCPASWVLLLSPSL